MADDQEPTHKNHEAYLVPGLQRGLLVLEAIASAGTPLGVTEIAKRLNLTRSSVFRLIYTLRHMGFLEPAPNSKEFTLGARVLNIGFAYLASKDIIAVSEADLETLRDETGVTAHLGIRDARDVLYLNCVQTRSGFLSNMNVGARRPAHAVPMGWVLLGDLSAREVAEIFGRGGFPALSERTPRDLDALMAHVTEAARKGYVVSRAFLEPGGSSITAPVFDHNGRIVAAIDISGPDSAYDPARPEADYVAAVLNTARRISARLGYVDRAA